MQRRWHREINRRIRAAGHTVPVTRKAWRVSIDAVPMPQWAIDKALQAVSSSDTHVWLRSRADAKRLHALNKAWGGCGSIDAAEYRRCPVSDGLLLGRAASEMREWQRLHPGQKKQCGPDCKEMV
jgi:hypothetical protein